MVRRRTSVAERKVLRDAISVGGIDHHGLSQASATFGVLGLKQVTPAGLRAEHLAAPGDPEPLGHGFPCLDTFGSTHSFRLSLKRARTIWTGYWRSKR